MDMYNDDVFTNSRREQGKVYFLNSTADEWMIKLYPNQDRVTEVAGKKVQVRHESI